MKIFMCHSSKQRLFVKEMKKYLPHQISVWIDEKEIVIGENISTSITKAIKGECDFFIVVIDEYALKSSWVLDEIKLALIREEELGRIFFLPIVIDNNAWTKLDDSKIKSKKFLYCHDFTDSAIEAVSNELASELFTWLCREFDNKNINASNEIKAENFFYTLDEKIESNFPQLIKDAKSVSILARTAVNLLAQYERQFEELGKRKCPVRLLFISPQSDASKYVYGTNPEIFDENIRRMNHHLARLKNKSGIFFEAKCIKHAPTTSLILIEKERDNFIIVQLYFLHSRISRDRPLFKVLSGDKWYNAFYEEFAQLWEDASDVI